VYLVFIIFKQINFYLDYYKSSCCDIYVWTYIQMAQIVMLNMYRKSNENSYNTAVIMVSKFLVQVHMYYGRRHSKTRNTAV